MRLLSTVAAGALAEPLVWSETATPFAWITSHTFRKTASTILDEAALSARLVADQLGQARPSMTQDVSVGLRAGGSEAANALGAALGQVVEPHHPTHHAPDTGEPSE